MEVQPTSGDDRLTVPVPHRPSWAWLLVLIYFFSGVIGIAYEILWVRMLSLQFGVSIFSVVVTIVAFMAGLGLGSLIGAALSRNLTRPLLAFAALEAGVAAFALGMPLMFRQLDAWLGVVAAAGGLGQWFVCQAVAAFAVLMVPAVLMGAGFPLILRALARSGIPLGKVYGLNTLGGAAGALLPLALLPTIGWVHAIELLAACGIAIAVCVAFLGARLPVIFTPPVIPGTGTGERPPAGTLLAYAGVGLAALMLEIGWTRLFGMLLLRTEYVLAIVLAVFLVGIGIGSLAIRWRSTGPWLDWFPVLASAAALATLWLLPVLAAWADQTQFESLSEAILFQGLSIAALTLPVTLIMGAWLPLLSHHVGGRAGSVSGAWLYGANAVGSAAGVLLAGFVFVPWVGTAATIAMAALLLFVCGMWWVQSRRFWLAGAALLLLAIPVAELPGINVLLPGTHAESRELRVYEDALSITHVVEQSDGQRLLLSDLRRMDASTDPVAVAVQKNQARLPLLLHPRPETVLFLGLGTGISAAGAADVPDISAVAVELSRGAIDAAAHWFKPVNDNVTARIRVVHDDARRYLRVTPEKYDVIIGDLFHPDLVGRSNLLSVQQFQRARERLGHDGIFTQWIALNQFDAGSLDIVLRSFRQVFPEHLLFLDGFRLALVGLNDPWPGVTGLLEGLQRLDEEQRASITGGEGVWTWLGRYWGTISPSSGKIQDEWIPQIEFRLPQARFAGEFDLGSLLEVLLQQRPTVEDAAAALKVPALFLPEFDRAYIATELAARSWLASLQQQSSTSQRLLRMAYQANPRDRLVSTDLADQMFASIPQAIARGMDRKQALQEILAIFPDHVEALKALRRLESARNNVIAAEALQRRLEVLAPLDNEVRAGSAGPR